MSLPSAAATRYGLKWVAKKARTAPESAPSISSPAAQGTCHNARVFALASNARQPTTNAGHAAATGSALQPGRTVHTAGVNSVGGAGGAGAGTGGGAGAGAGGDTVWQPA